MSDITSGAHPSQINTIYSGGPTAGTDDALVISDLYPENLNDPSYINASDVFWKFIRDADRKTQVTRTYYDEIRTIDTENPWTLFVNECADQGTIDAYIEDFEKRVRNRIGTVSYMEEWQENEFAASTDLEDDDVYFYTSATHYNYDIHGNVSTLIQDYGNRMGVLGTFTNSFVINPQATNSDVDCSVNSPSRRTIDLFRTDYEYDLISGNVIETIYQEGQPEEFHHRFEYDADNRIAAVETSNDGTTWETDAKYFYYKHGPLARVEIGDNQIQGCDYAYTIQGWMKGVNSNNVAGGGDIGQDDGTVFAEDEFAFALRYFNEVDPKDASIIRQDYNPIGGSDPFALASLAGQPEGASMYNGNISARTNSIRAFGNASGETTAYGYDQLNRIKSSAVYNGSTATDKYRTYYAYDGNGNLDTLMRWDASGALMDDFRYFYANEASGFCPQQQPVESRERPCRSNF